jgi:hypothetical protein
MADAATPSYPHTRTPSGGALTAAPRLPTVNDEERAELKRPFPPDLMLHRLHILLTRQAQRGVALLTALVVLAGPLGIPLPRPVIKDTSRPFPCMHHACGCSTAESCWHGCCCLSDQQKLAWASKHGVTPPKEFASKSSAAGQHSCCSSDTCQSPSTEGSSDSRDWHFVHIDAVRKCQGLGSLWAVLGLALPPPESESFETELMLVSWLAPMSAAQATSPAFDPATPPPRASI